MSLPYDPTLFGDPWEGDYPPNWNPYGNNPYGEGNTNYDEGRSRRHGTPTPRDPDQPHPWEEEDWDRDQPGEGRGRDSRRRTGRRRDTGTGPDGEDYIDPEEQAYRDFWETMVNWSKGLNAEDYMTQISPELQKLADEGYGAQWFRQSYAWNMDEASRAKAQQLNQLGQQEATSGLVSGFNQRARDLTQFGFDVQGVLQQAALTNQQEGVKQGAQFEIDQILQENEALAGQIGLFNEMTEFEKQRMKDMLKYSTEEKFRKDALQHQQETAGNWSAWVKFLTFLGLSL